MQLPHERVFVHLAYLDDSDTKAKARKWQVMSGVVIKDAKFNLIDIAMQGLVLDLIPPEKLPDFEEFHACELYGGYEVFEGIEQTKRFDTISRLLNLLAFGKMSVVYGAVDLAKLASEVHASADPMDISFRICLKGIQKWTSDRIMSKHGPWEDSLARNDTALLDSWLEELVIVIADECDKKLRDTLNKSFRSLRPPRRLKEERRKLYHFHDDMYFGDSKYSVGIQLADLCSYFIARHLEGDSEIEGFYKIIEPHIVFREAHPVDQYASALASAFK